MGVTSNPGAGGSTLERSSREARQDGTLYYIYASSAGQSPGANVQILSPDSSTDKFVASLNEEKVIILSSAPSPTASLDSSDKTNKWFQELDSNATGSITVDKSTKSVESFGFKLEKPWQLTFSSASTVLLFTFGAPALIGGDTGTRIPVPGIDTNGVTLTCGLDFTQTAEIKDAKLKDLFTYAEAADMTEYLPSDLLDLAVTLKTPGKTDQPKRNALWYAPVADRRVNIRLQFQMPSFGPLQQILGAALEGFTLKSTDVICKKRMLLAETEVGKKALTRGEIAFSVECSVKGHAEGATEVSMVAGLEFKPSSITLTFMFDSEDGLKAILLWLGSLIDDTTLEPFVNDILGKTENGQHVLGGPRLRRMEVGLDTSKDARKPRLSSLSFDIEVSANIGNASNPVVFLISYSWSSFAGGTGTLAGQLWNDSDLPADLDLLPHDEKWTVLRPLTPSPARSIQIDSLIPGQTVANIPDTLPSEITSAYLELSQDSFEIRCSVAANPISPGSAPQPQLGEVMLDASFHWGQSKSFTLDVIINALIVPSEASSLTMPAVLTGSLSYDSSGGKWALTGSLSGLYASTLVDFFDDEAKDHVGPLIESIAIETLTVTYTYEPVAGGTAKSKSKASTFTIAGDLLIAGLRLALDFSHDKDHFSFTAKLNPEGKTVKIGDVLADTLGSNIALPDFVYNTELVGATEDAFRLDVLKQKTPMSDGTTAESFQFLAQLNLVHVHIDFARLHDRTWDAKAPSKQLFKVAINGFAGMELDLPLIGKLVQPLDELYFLWVQAPTTPPGAAPGKATGLTRTDIAQLNTSLKDELVVKDKIKIDQRRPTDLLVAAGCHFAVTIRSTTGERTCLLDYEFMKPSPSSATRTLKVGEVDESGPSAQAPYKKIAGPLSISNVGLKYKDKKLAIMFDAIFQLGPLGFSLVGFSLGAAFTTLDDVPTITPDIQGLAASFDRPPLSIAGVIRHANDGGIDYYAGGLIVGWTVYQFEAAGFYGIVTAPGNNGFRTVFVFAKLNGRLVTLGFAEITSVCGGFGYNSSLRLPTCDEVYQFPFIDSSGLSNKGNAMEVIQKLVEPGPSAWFHPLDNVYWLAVGMKVGAFQMLSIDAVVAVQFGDAIKLGIFAVATADIPSPASPIKLAHVELGISAVADFDYGTLKIEAQLSPRSYILDPSCHLTGGCGLYYWFDAPHADKSSVGQFVFTLGGYHQAYRVPIGYPSPRRLGISWDLGGGLKISGQAYFAVTPKACMAGGRLHASFKAGPISAWFDAFADFLINYKPFYFNMQAGLSVGVGFSIDIWFIHIRISVEIGAQLYLWGPPIAGRVHVDLWIVAFDINFGHSSSSDEGVTLTQFYELVLQTSTTSSLAAARKAMLSIGEGEKAQGKVLDKRGHNFLARSGLLNPTDKPEREQNETWIVRGGSFSFVIECKMAINAVKDDANKDPIITHGDAGNDIDVFSKPMKLTKPMTSTVVVQIKQEGMSELDEGWQYDKYIKIVPRALWGKYDPRTDPHKGGNNIKDLLNSDNGAVSLMMGVQMTAPKPIMSPDPLPAYVVADADLQTLPAERAFPTIANADGAWAPGPPATGEPKDQYEAVYKAWTSPAMGTGEDGQQGFVGALADSLKWADAGKLKGIAGIPQRLKKGFMNLYVAAPLLTLENSHL